MNFSGTGARMLCSRWNGSRTDQSSSGPTTASSWQLRNPDTCTPTRKRLKIAASSSFTWSTGNSNQKFQCSTTIVWIPPIVDRPILVLKCEQGFVGYKTGSGSKLECNKANYEAVQVERGPKGLVFFKGTIRSWRIRWRDDLIERFFLFIWLQVNTVSTGRPTRMASVPTVTRRKDIIWNFANLPSCASRRPAVDIWLPRRTARSKPAVWVSRRLRVGNFKERKSFIPEFLKKYRIF